MAFVKTPKQVLACDVLNQHEHALLYGGSRSAKTTIIIRNIFLRAIKVPSRHLVARFRFNHAKTSLWHDTIPKVHKMCFPELTLGFNKADWFIEVPTVCGNTSQIWLGGIDDKDRVEKILGNEYSTIFLNECSQIQYDAVTTLRTRLAENVGLKNKFYYDLNPSGRKHWSYQEFIERKMPGTMEQSTIDSGYLLMNPMDNIENLPESYIKTLQSLPKRQRQRFLDGLYLTEVEGALWTDAMISDARVNETGNITHTVVAIDPATTNNPGSDECGIVVCEKDDLGQGVLEGDYSGKMSTRKWAQKAVNLYKEKRANAIVAEVNQGGDLVEDVIRNIDPTIKVIKVHAAKGKFARAEPISALCENNEYKNISICHPKPCPELESELTEWVPLESKSSPNRLDAYVWGMTYLVGKAQSIPKVRSL